MRILKKIILKNFPMWATRECYPRPCSGSQRA